MVKVKVNDTEFYLDGYLKQNLDIMKEELRKDFDAVLLVTGRERFGKSTLASQIAYYIDPTYDLSRCVFTPTQVIEAVDKAKKYQAIVFDEAHAYLNVRQTMGKSNFLLNKMMAEMGFKNVFFIIVLPSFFDLDRYPALHRSTGLIYVNKRGNFRVFDYDRKRQLYIEGKKKHNYNAAYSNFHGSFTKFFPLVKEEYEAKKKSAVSEYEENKPGKREEKLKQKLNMAINNLAKNSNLSHRKVSELTGLSKGSVGRLLTNGPISS